MSISVFDIYTIGIGPSSSHTVGPMKAARRFSDHLKKNQLIESVKSIKIELYGSLGATGKGHGSDRAVVLGLEGHMAHEICPDYLKNRFEEIKKNNELKILDRFSIPFSLKKDVSYKRKSLPGHPNGLCFQAIDGNGNELSKKIYYSIGGGFVVGEDLIDEPEKALDRKMPYEFSSSAELLSLCKKHKKSIAEIMLENEQTYRSRAQIQNDLLNIWEVMKSCIKAGTKNKGYLPGGLNVKRRAPKIYKNLKKKGEILLQDPLTILDWVNLYALAVNEENAGGGRVVTAPTNGAAGVIPAVLNYLVKFCPKSCKEEIETFLLTAGAIAILYKKNASISGADVGCQGEVGVACSMAAGGLAAALGGSPQQVENAAEIAMEHNLGLTCDPVGGLVQVPCIERNAMGAVKAINASRMALTGDGKHFVSLDSVIKTMWQTGKDMNSRYKETSRGGLAVNIIEC